VQKAYAEEGGYHIISLPDWIAEDGQTSLVQVEKLEYLLGKWYHISVCRNNYA
jgi:hypothetical protein